MTASSFFKKVAQAKSTQVGTRFRDGVYDLTVVKVLCEKKEAGMCFIVELYVDKASNSADAYYKGPDACWASDEGAKLMPANEVGTTASVVWVLDGTNKSALSNVKAWALALLDVSEEGLDEDDFAETLEAMTQKDQPARGRRIHLETARKTIKSGKNVGRPFVGTNWTHIAQTDEEIEARCAELDKAEKAAAKAA